MEIMLKRITQSGEYANEVVLLTKRKSYTFGRKPQNDVVLFAKTISKSHCIIHHNSEGLFIEVLQSSSGVIINSKLFTSGAIVRLYHNDLIDIGRVFKYIMQVKLSALLSKIKNKDTNLKSQVGAKKDFSKDNSNYNDIWNHSFKELAQNVDDKSGNVAFGLVKNALQNYDVKLKPKGFDLTNSGNENAFEEKDHKIMINSETKMHSLILKACKKPKNVIKVEEDECESFKYALKGHSLTHSNEKRLACSICDNKYKDKIALSSHVPLHFEGGKNECKKCGKCFLKKKILNAHKIMHDKRKFWCQVCKKSFQTACNLKHHIFRGHTVQKNKFHCAVCNTEYKFKRDLKIHYQSHIITGIQKCKICNVRFSSKAKLEKHCEKHFKEKLISCTICGRIFDDQNLLKNHCLQSLLSDGNCSTKLY